MADKVGVSYQQLQKYENGSNRVTASRLRLIAEIIGVSVNDFFPENFPLNDTIDNIYQLEKTTCKLIMHLLKRSKEEQATIASSFLGLLKTNDDLFLELSSTLASKTPARQRDIIQDLIATIQEKNVWVIKKFHF